MTRYQQLQERREKLIQLNKRHAYTVCKHPKMDKYFNLLLQINTECVRIQMRHDKKFDKSNYKFTAI
jgi:hypothetical protein